MLSKVTLTNYRGFQAHSIDLKPLTVLVGRNNAGKSTLVEALQLVSVVTQRLGGLNFRDPPSWTGQPRRHRGVRPSLDGLGIDFKTICYRYEPPPAVVHAEFASGEAVEFFIHDEGDGFAVVFDSEGEVIRSKGRTRDLAFPQVHILPQVGPLEPNEVILTGDYVRRNVSSPLAPRHFRNQLRLFPGPYRAFRELAEETWPGLQVQSLSGARGMPGDELFLGIRDRDFVAEVGRMGHGLQMWLQTMWFLARTPKGCSVVLDEPDVYMHPDLQRRMVRVVRDRFNQVLVATHSVEIMAEVAPSEILIIDRDNEQSVFANSDPGVQELIERLGGIHNIHLARLWTSKRCLLVEGKDLDYLKLVHDLLFPGNATPLDDIPNLSIGGWGGWNYAIGSSLFIRNSFGESVSIYCILDSDYYTEETINERLEAAAKKNVNLHIWQRKEIENYFLIPATIARLINSEAKRGPLPLATDTVRERLNSIADGLKLQAQDDISEQIYLKNRSDGTKKANEAARELMDAASSSLDSKLAVVSGKTVLGQLANWSQTEFGVSLGLSSIIRALAEDEVPQEVRDVVNAIHRDSGFSSRRWRRAVGP